MATIREELGPTILKMRQLGGTAPEQKTFWQRLWPQRNKIDRSMMNGLADEIELALESVAGR